MRIEQVADHESLIRWLDDRFVDFFLEEWRETIARGGTFLAAYEGDAILGYLEAEPHTPGSTYIKHVLVSPDHLRNGVARSLYDTLAQHTRARELLAQVPHEYAASVGFHNSYRQRIDPGAGEFTGGWWVCPSPQRF